MLHFRLFRSFVYPRLDPICLFAHVMNTNMLLLCPLFDSKKVLMPWIRPSLVCLGSLDQTHVHPYVLLKLDPYPLVLVSGQIFSRLTTLSYIGLSLECLCALEQSSFCSFVQTPIRPFECSVWTLFKLL